MNALLFKRIHLMDNHDLDNESNARADKRARLQTLLFSIALILTAVVLWLLVARSPAQPVENQTSQPVSGPGPVNFYP